MTNSKATKKALFMSVISLMLCFTMLMGATFAWFTDTVKSSSNIIKAGNLKIAMHWADGTVDPDDASWEDASEKAIFDYQLWEPGYVDVKHVKIENIGSLALKYQLRIVPTGEVSILADVIDVYYLDPAEAITGRADLKAENRLGTLSEVIGKFNETAQGTLLANDNASDNHKDTVTIALKMQESATNEYQDKSIGSSFAVELFATQLEAEEDSFDNTYDKNAQYEMKDDGTIVVFSKEGLSAVAELASTDTSITSVNYNGEDVPVVRDSAALDAAVNEDNNIVVLTSGSYTVDTAKNTEVAIVGNGENTTLSIESEGEYNTDYGFDGSTVTFENLVFNVGGYLNGYARMNATYNNCVINGTYTLNGESVFNNCTFNKTGDDYCIWTWGAPTAEFNNCTFNTSGKAILLYGGANTVLKANNCVFNDANDYAEVNNKAAIEVGSDWTTDTKEIIATNCTVNGFDITDKGFGTGSTLWGNKNSLSTDRLNVVIDGVDVY